MIPARAALRPGLGITYLTRTDCTPVLLIIDKKEAQVAYDADNYTLTIPSKINDQLIPQIEQAMDSHNISFCPTGTRRFAGGCWVLGQRGNDCNQTCASVNGLNYDGVMVGIDAEQCKGLSTLFGYVNIEAGNMQGTCDPAVGCEVYKDGKTNFCMKGWPEVKSSDDPRFCACRQE